MVVIDGFFSARGRGYWPAVGRECGETSSICMVDRRPGSIQFLPTARDAEKRSGGADAVQVRASYRGPLLCSRIHHLALAEFGVSDFRASQSPVRRTLLEDVEHLERWVGREAMVGAVSWIMRRHA